MTDDAFTPNDSLALMDAGIVAPSPAVADNVVRGAAHALALAEGQAAAVNDLRKGLLAVERLFKLRGAQLTDTNKLVAQRIRTERTLGTTIEQGKAEGMFRDGRPEKTVTRHDRFSLTDIGLTKNQSSLFQKLALIEADELEQWMRGILEAPGSPELPGARLRLLAEQPPLTG